jgi:hypothetical protein
VDESFHHRTSTINDSSLPFNQNYNGCYRFFPLLFEPELLLDVAGAGPDRPDDDRPTEPDLPPPDELLPLLTLSRLGEPLLTFPVLFWSGDFLDVDGLSVTFGEAGCR